MNALLIIAHGSRKQSSNDEVAQLAQRTAQLPSDFELISHGFLELTTPNVPDAIQALVEQGATNIVVMPYFLAAGYHVQEDLPALLEEAKQRHPDIKISRVAHIGSADLMPNWVLEQVKASPVQ